jgi:hypothetical protein
MHVKSATALCFGLALFGLAAAPADAQTRRQAVTADGTRYVVVGEDGRARTKVIVQKRSFLDGGTEVLPSSKPLPNNVWPFGYTALDIIERTNGGGLRYPLPGPYDLPGKDNPFLW